MPSSIDPPPPRRRWRVLLLLSAAELLGMSLWFTASAVGPALQSAWDLSDHQIGWLTTTVQLGFVAGTALAAILNLADIVPARVYFSVSAVLAAAVNGLLVVAPGYETALALRFLTGFLLAGVYPPAMKMIATWFKTGRGLAIGAIVAALTLGKAAPYLVSAADGADLNLVVLTASVGALIGALMVGLGYEDGPHEFARRPFSWRLVGTVVGDRRTRLAIGGYLGHMWELYAGWSLVAVFFFDHYSARGLTAAGAAGSAGMVAFSVIAMGGIGSVVAGQWADRLGRERVAIWSMAVSGTCSLIIGWLLYAPPWISIGLGLIWGFAIVADSAQFSAVVTEVAPPHAVGTALTLQTSLGFLLTAGSIWATVEIFTRFGWGPAFSLLAIGPALGIVSMLRLSAARRAGVVAIPAS